MQTYYDQLRAWHWALPALSASPAKSRPFHHFASERLRNHGLFEFQAQFACLEARLMKFHSKPFA